MKASKILRFVNLLLAGTLTGNEVGTLAGVHPALGELSPAEQIRAEQEVRRWLGAIMPFWMGLTIASSVLVALSSRGKEGSGEHSSERPVWWRCSPPRGSATSRSTGA
jgi:hypothetical protein